MKKIVALICVLALTLSLAACGKNSFDEPSDLILDGTYIAVDDENYLTTLEIPDGQLPEGTLVDGFTFGAALDENSENDSDSMVMAISIANQSSDTLATYTIKDGKLEFYNYEFDFEKDGTSIYIGGVKFVLQGDGTEQQHAVADAPESSETISDSVAGNTPGNIINGGRAAYYDGWIYYSDSDHDMLYKMKPDGSEVTEVGDYSCWCMNIVDGWIYYKDRSQYISKVKTDGSERSTLNYDESDCVTVAGDWIYYINASYGETIFRMRTDGSDNIQLNEDESDYLNVADGWIYYTNRNDNSGIYRMRLDGAENAMLYPNPAAYLCVADDWIYFNDGGQMRRVHTDGSDGTDAAMFGDGKIRFPNVSGDYIYGVNDQGIYQIPIAGMGDTYTQINTDYNSNTISVVGDWIFYFSDAKFFKMKTDGSNIEMVG